jgi:hypothetical protein
MGLMMAKHYIDSHNPPIIPMKGISVYYSGKENILYSNLALSDGLELHFIDDVNPYIELSYPIDHKVVFSIRENLIHFIVIGESEEKDKILTKTETIKYPWLPTFNGIRVSRMTEDEYKESQLSSWPNFLS